MAETKYDYWTIYKLLLCQGVFTGLRITGLRITGCPITGHPITGPDGGVLGLGIIQQVFHEGILCMCRQCLIYLRLLGSITRMTGKTRRNSLVHATHPLLGFVPKEIDRPLHFMLGKN